MAATGDVSVYSQTVDGRSGGARPAALCPDIRRLPLVRHESGSVDRDAPLLAGGCAFRVRGAADLDVLSVVEGLHFGRCEFEFTLRVDGAGRVGAGYMTVGGPSPCNDVVSCYDSSDYSTEPLEGQIVARRDGRLRLEMDMCVDTCMGRFAGELSLGMERDGTAAPWRMVADDATVGTSGWKFDGGLRLQASHGLDVRAAGAGPPSGAQAAIPGWPLRWPIPIG